MRFLKALRACAAAGRIPVIPDFKMISPAEGPLFRGRDVTEAARAMERAGAPVLSVVTEPHEFGGSKELLRDIAAAVDIPVLRKDFLKSRADIEESAELGAQAVLLICAAMDEATLRELYAAALEMGIAPLVETHSAAEMRLAASLGAELIGINNKDILALEKDSGTVATTGALAALKPRGAFLVSESGIKSADDIIAARQSGADAVLIGTAVWQAEDPFAFYRQISGIRV